MSETRRFDLPDGYDMKSSIGFLGMKAAGRPPLTDREAWLAFRSPEGPVTIEVQHRGSRAEATAWGPGAEWGINQVPSILGLDDDPDGMPTPPGLVRDLFRRTPGLRLGHTGVVFDAILPTILGQRVTSREAKQGYRKLVQWHGEDAPGPAPLRLAPDPVFLAGLPYYEYHRAGIERSRAQIVTEAARRAKRLQEIIGMDRESAWQRLQAVRGVGPWTAAMVMGIAWGDQDAIPVGDYHLPNMVAFALAGEPRGDDDRMLELLEPYRPQRRRALVLIKGSGIKAPKYGPRSAIRSIERI